MNSMEKCKNCGRIFRYSSGHVLCYECKREDVFTYTKIASYLRTHESATINDIAKEFNITEKKIARYIRDGQIELGKDSKDGINCIRCGAIIRRGRYCNKCLAYVNKQINNAAEDIKQKIKDERAKGDV